MVLFSSTAKGRVLKFHSAAIDPAVLVVLGASGREAISHYYAFELDLVSQRDDLDSAELLRAPCWLGIKQRVHLKGSPRPGIQTLKIHGMLSSFVQGEQTKGWVSYRAVLVPRLWRLAHNQGSRIFQDRTVPEIVEDILKSNGFQKTDYAFRLSRPYPKREYVAQWQESDLDFVSRLLEGEGISYFFLQDDEREILVMGDSDAAWTPVAAPDALPYRPKGIAGEGLTGWFAEESVRAIECHHRSVPSGVELRDYNWRTPSTELRTTNLVTSNGFGTVYLYGEHFKDADEGKTLARIRSEELQCRERQFEGVGDARAFRAGHLFTLTEHFRKDNFFNRRYLLTEIRHKTEQTLQLDTGHTLSASYANEFVAVPADARFRPKRKTAKPKIAGTVTARVDAAGAGEYAEIDDLGRYKVHFHFDAAPKGAGQSSRWIRMAQAASGGDMGIHFPLKKGAEVAVAFTNGDPDRPYIVAAVPNPETASPVTSGNHTQSILLTPTAAITIENLKGSEFLSMGTVAHGSYFSLGAAHNSPAYCSIATPDGAVIGTREGVSINAGKSVSIAAGAPGHDEGIAGGSGHTSAIVTGATIAMGALALVGGQYLEKAATGHVSKLALAADIVGFAAGAGGSVAHKNVYISSPTKIAAVAGGEVMLGATFAVDVTALGVANIQSLLGTLVAGVASVTVVSAGRADLVSLISDVYIEAKKRGSVHVAAKKTVNVIGDTKDVNVHAKVNGVFNAGGTLTLSANKLILGADSAPASSSKKLKLPKAVPPPHEGRIDTLQGFVETLCDLKVEKKFDLRAGEALRLAAGPEVWTLRMDDKCVRIGKKGERPEVWLWDDKIRIGFDRHTWAEFKETEITLWAKANKVILNENQIDVIGKKVKVNGENLLVE